MPCVGRGCREDPVFEITSHGIAVGLCANHVKAPKMYVGLAPDDGANDYLKLYAVLSSRELFWKVMKDFTNEVSRAEKKRQGKSAWFNRDKIAIRLNYSLSRYEGLCWFGTQQKIMSGLLTADEFKGAIVNGYMVKDPGPGADHGEYSHRLQWNYIMRVMTNKFSTPKTSDWASTPLELYSRTMANADFNAGTGNLWGTLLEGSTGTGMSNCPGDPSWVNRQFREHKDLSSTSFGVTLTTRYNKRVGLEDQVKSLLEERGYSVDETPTGQLARNKDLKLHGVLEYLYKWKKAGRVGRASWKDAEPAEKAAEELWADVFQQKYSGSRKRFKRAAYVDPDDDTRLIISDGLLLHRNESVTDAPLNERIASSKGGLNPAYRYSSSVGARRA